MSDTDSELAQEAEALFQEQSALVRRATHPLIKATLGTAPFSGGIASLLGDVAQRRKEIHLRQFLVNLASHVEGGHHQLRDKLDSAFIQTDEFAATVESIMQEAAKTADGRKLEYLEQFFISSALKIRPDVTWRELFMQYVRQLSGIHLSVLASFYDRQGALPDSDRVTGVEITGKVPYFVADVTSQFSEDDARTVKIACIDLSNLGLLVDWRILRKGYKEIHKAFVLSESGALLFRFINAEWPSSKE